MGSTFAKNLRTLPLATFLQFSLKSQRLMNAFNRLIAASNTNDNEVFDQLSSCSDLFSFSYATGELIDGF